MGTSDTLSKSNYITGLDNPRQMWYEAQGVIALDAGERWRMKQGQAVAEAARDEFPEGIFIGGKPTKDHLQSGQPLFEAQFQSDGLSARTDILCPDPTGGWVLTEVKSSTMKRRPSQKEAMQDAAFQALVFEQAGLDITRVEIMHLNPEYERPDRGPLFKTFRLGRKRAELVEAVRREAPRLKQVLRQSTPPSREVSRDCKKCDCPEPCVPLPQQSVFTLPDLYYQHIDQLLADGRLTLDEVDGHRLLKPRHRHYIEAVRTQEPYVNSSAIQDALETLEYPIHFFDFEAIDWALPQFEGTSPWQKIPFQYSLHILRNDRSIEHREFLHSSRRDPRQPLVEQMLHDVGERGSIVVYHSMFEKKRLEELKEAFPKYHHALQSIIDRLWDQADIFKNWHYIHPAQKGSWSLKNVLPALAPDLAYDDLDVQDGMAAVLRYNDLLECRSTSTRNNIRTELLEYCGRDTYAMVAIHQELRELVGF